MSEQTQIFDRIQPLIPSGGAPTSITVGQTFNVPVTLTGPSIVKVQVNGPQTTLSEEDIDSVYPAPGSTESPDEFLPHIAIRRRTLPWERTGPAPQTPWLALLLLKASELQGSGGSVFGDHGGVVLGGLQNQPVAVLNPGGGPAAGGPVINPGAGLQGAGLQGVGAAAVFQSRTTAFGAAGAGNVFAGKQTVDLSRFNAGYFPQLTLSRPATVDGTVSTVKVRDPAGYAKMIASGLADGTAVSLLFLKNSVFAAVCPLASEVPFLCHARRTNKDGVVSDHAMVVSARLPDASTTPVELHTAFLVSLENRSDAFLPERGSKPNGEIGLIVLHSWKFTPSTGGDFEEVMKAIHIRPNGGVLRFGNLPEDVPTGKTAPLSAKLDGLLDSHGNFLEPLPHAQPGNATYRGPLLPFPAPPRSRGFAVRSAPEEFADGANTALPHDYSYAAAFELGRLLAIANQDVMEDLRAVHAIPPKPAEHDYIQQNLLPLALQKKDWVVDPAMQVSQPWDMVSNNATVAVVKDAAQFATLGVADVSGVAQQAAQFAGVQAQLEGLQTAALSQIAQIDINTIGAPELETKFGGVMNKVLSH